MYPSRFNKAVKTKKQTNKKKDAPPKESNLCQDQNVKYCHQDFIKFIGFPIIPKQIKYELISAPAELWQPWE